MAVIFSLFWTILTTYIEHMVFITEPYGKNSHWTFYNKSSENIFIGPGALTIDTIQNKSTG